MKYSFRLAEIKDCKELSKLKRNVWETTYRGIYPEQKFNDYDFIENEKMFESIISNEEIELYVVQSDNKLVGYMSVGKPMRPFLDYEQEIGLFYIQKDFQRLGIGRQLFNIAYKKIKEKGYSCFFISCNKYNYPAQKFYEKMGGKIIHIDEDNKNKSLPQIKYLYQIN